MNQKCPYLTDPNDNSKLVTFVCQGRNDDYMGNFRWRLETALNSRIKYLSTLNALDDVEVIVADWGSDRPLYHDLELTQEAKQNIQFLVVPPDIATKHNKGSPFSTSHPLNAIVRRAKGKYIFFCDSDVIIPLDSLAKLIQSMRQGYIQEYNLDDSFFWASKYHVPNDLVKQSLPLELIEQHIETNWQSYQTEKVDTTNFVGCGVGLLMKREMWLASSGLHEELVHWGWNDIEWQKRLASRYRWQDLENFGMKMFHLEHYADRTNNFIQQCGKIENPRIVSESFSPNPPDWGLYNEQLTLVDGYGLIIDPTSRKSGAKSHYRFDTSRQSPPSVSEIVASNPLYKNITERFEYDDRNWFTNQASLSVVLERLKPKKVLEVGSFLGASARFFAAFPSITEVYCVDHWDRNRQQNYTPGYFNERFVNNTYEIFLANTIHRMHGEKIKPVRLDSRAAADYLGKHGHTFDLIYIDGDHSTLGAARDLELFMPLLNPDGLLCGDDWAWQTEPNNVAGAVITFAKSRGMNVFHRDNFWMVLPEQITAEPPSANA